MNRCLTGLVAAVVSLAMAQAVSAQTTVARGKEIVTRYCGGCHAVGAEGRSPNPASPAFRNLGRRFPMGVLEEELRAGMLTGHPKMPHFQFSQAQITDIMDYLRSVQNSRRLAELDADRSNEKAGRPGGTAGL